MQILGPVRQEKVIELIEKGSLRDEDELSSANGFWFWLHEKDLVERYLYNREPQPFNPIAEAKSVLTSDEDAPAFNIDRREQAESPSQEDLDYPEDFTEDDEGEERDDVTQVVASQEVASPSLTQEELELEPIEIEAPEEEEFELNLLKPTGKPVPSHEPIKADSPKAVIQKPKGKKHRPTPTITKNDRYLFVLLVLVVALVVGVVYYYRTIINKPLPGFEVSWVVPSAHAQTLLMPTSSKKKRQHDIA
jgi:hypothetical protein